MNLNRSWSPGRYARRLLLIYMLVCFSVSRAQDLSSLCETSLSMSIQSQFNLELPLTKKEKKELRGIAKREIQVRWGKRPLNGLDLRFSEIAALIRILDGSLKDVFDQVGSLDRFRKSETSERDLLAAVQKLNPSSPADSTHHRATMPSYEIVGQALAVSGENGAVRTLILELLRLYYYQPAINIVARADALTNGTRDQILFHIYRLLSTYRRISMDQTRTMINALSLVKSPKNQERRNHLLKEIGAKLLSDAVDWDMDKEGAANGDFVPDESVERFALGLRALRLSGKPLAYRLTDRGQTEPITSITNATDFEKFMDLTNRMFKRTVFDGSVNLKPFIEMAYALKANDHEFRVQAMAERWRTIIERRRKDFILRNKRTGRNDMAKAIEAYTLVSVQLARLAGHDGTVRDLFADVVAGHVLPLNYELLKNDFVYELLKYLPREDFAGGFNRISEVLKPMSVVLLRDGLRRRAGKILHQNWPEPAVFNSSFVDEVQQRAYNRILYYRHMIEWNIRYLPGEALDAETALTSQRLRSDGEYAQKLRAMLLSAHDGKGLLALSVTLTDNFETLSETTDISPIEVYVLGKMLNPSGSVDH